MTSRRLDEKSKQIPPALRGSAGSGGSGRSRSRSGSVGLGPSARPGAAPPARGEPGPHPSTNPAPVLRPRDPSGHGQDPDPKPRSHCRSQPRFGPGVRGGNASDGPGPIPDTAELREAGPGLSPGWGRGGAVASGAGPAQCDVGKAATPAVSARVLDRYGWTHRAGPAPCGGTPARAGGAGFRPSGLYSPAPRASGLRGKESEREMENENRGADGVVGMRVTRTEGSLNPLGPAPRRRSGAPRSCAGPAPPINPGGSAPAPLGAVHARFGVWWDWRSERCAELEALRWYRHRDLGPESWVRILLVSARGPGRSRSAGGVHDLGWGEDRDRGGREEPLRDGRWDRARCCYFAPASAGTGLGSRRGSGYVRFVAVGSWGRAGAGPRRRAAVPRSRRWIAAGADEAQAPPLPAPGPSRRSRSLGAACRTQSGGASAAPPGGSSALRCGPGPAAPRGCGAPPAPEPRGHRTPLGRAAPSYSSPVPEPRGLPPAAPPPNERSWIAAGGRSRSEAGAGAESGLLPVRDRGPVGARSCSSRSSDTCWEILNWKEPRGSSSQTVINYWPTWGLNSESWPCQHAASST
ncbi:collagen alpha-1(I) chain-like [Vidua chalybeata]|uniref:collagen alpha-1(I) chain-like n=1 Tax=Vidua chalybeata TaxID=81927 RepID=UPI0023A794D5|nr:collagen alpha-1(I) chain-like [Vidua chalybeata]